MSVQLAEQYGIDPLHEDVLHKHANARIYTGIPGVDGLNTAAYAHIEADYVADDLLKDVMDSAERPRHKEPIAEAVTIPDEFAESAANSAERIGRAIARNYGTLVHYIDITKVSADPDVYCRGVDYAENRTGEDFVVAFGEAVVDEHDQSIPSRNLLSVLRERAMPSILVTSESLQLID